MEVFAEVHDEGLVVSMATYPRSFQSVSRMSQCPESMLSAAVTRLIIGSLYLPLRTRLPFTRCLLARLGCDSRDGGALGAMQVSSDNFLMHGETGVGPSKMYPVLSSNVPKK